MIATTGCSTISNDTVTGDRLEALLARCFADERTRFANIHTGSPGCFLWRIERL